MIATVRPLYETQADRRREASVAGIISQRLNVSLLKLPIKYCVDFAAYDKTTLDLKSWIEVKCRNIESFQEMKIKYFIVALSKIMAGLQLAHTTGKPFFIYWGFLDNSIFYTEITTDLVAEVADVKVKGRFDRGDWQDQEPVICITKDMLKRF